MPADNMMASTPHVASPLRVHATMGNVPWLLRFELRGGSEPVHRSSMPPVPNVILACPGRTHPWPTSEAC